MNNPASQPGDGASVAAAQVIAFPLPGTGPAPTAPHSEDGHTLTMRDAHERALRRRQVWVRECWAVTASYALHGLFLGLFALTNTVPWWIAPLYAVPGLLAMPVLAQLISKGRTAHLADPSVSYVPSGLSIVMCLVGVAVFPQMAFAYALILFTVFLTASYRGSTRFVHGALVAVSVLFGLLTVGRGHPLQMPTASVGEQVLSWLFFVLVLGRCVMLSVVNTNSNLLLRQRTQQMTETLERIERLANHDELTGVLNRRRLLHILEEESTRSQRTQAPLCVAMLDLDNFNAINDTFGHLTGDRVLQQFAAAVHTQTRHTDRFGRCDGDSFLLILTEVDLAQAESAIERIRRALLRVNWRAIHPALRVTFSAGLATYQIGESTEQLLNRANQGLYLAKEGGRNCTRMAPTP
jgi:diguanylate cyclase